MGLKAAQVTTGSADKIARTRTGSGSRTGVPLMPNVKVTGAARFYRAASVLTAGLDRISFDLPLSANDVSKVARLDRGDFDHERTTCVGQATH